MIINKYYLFVILLIGLSCSSEKKSRTSTTSLNDNQTTNYSIDRDELKEEIKQELREELKKETRQYRQEKRYYHSSESGSVIVSQNGTKNFKWKKKCNHCGKTDNNTYNDSRFSGSLTTVYFCIRCKKQTKVKVTTTSD